MFDRGQRPDQRAVGKSILLLLDHQFVGQFGPVRRIQNRPLGHPKLVHRINDTGLSNDIEIPPLCDQDTCSSVRFQMTTKSALRAPGALRQRPNLAVIVRHQGEQAIRFAEISTANDDSLTAIEPGASLVITWLIPVSFCHL